MVARRGFLTGLLGAAAAPAMAKREMMEAMGIDPTASIGGIAESVGEVGVAASNWWGSPLQVLFEAQERARHESVRGGRYEHMKSWGPAFRHSQTAKDIALEMMIQRKAERDEGFRNSLLGAWSR